MNDQPDDPSHHERTLLPRSFISLPDFVWSRYRDTNHLVTWLQYHFNLAAAIKKYSSSEVERSLVVRWVVGSILHRMDPLSYFLFQPVLHDWCNKGRGMCYPVCGMAHIKEPLLLIDKSSLCGGSGFPFSLSEWSLTICLTPYNRR